MMTHGMAPDDVARINKTYFEEAILKYRLISLAADEVRERVEAHLEDLINMPNIDTEELYDFYHAQEVHSKRILSGFNAIDEDLNMMEDSIEQLHLDHPDR